MTAQSAHAYDPVEILHGLPAEFHDRFLAEYDAAMLASIYEQLTSVLAARPQVTVLASTEGAIAEAYQALTTILQTT